MAAVPKVTAAFFYKRKYIIILK